MAVQLTVAQKTKLQEIRDKTPWAKNYSDEVLLIMIKKYGSQFFDVEDVKWFVWGADPITGRALPAVGGFLSGPIVSGIFVAIVALFIISKFK